MEVKRGDLFYADLSVGVGSEQSGIRPVVVIQNDSGNRFSTTIIISPLTSSKKKNIPTHTFIKSRDDLKENSIEQMRTIDKSRLIRKIGELTPLEMERINKCIRISLGV